MIQFLYLLGKLYGVKDLRLIFYTILISIFMLATIYVSYRNNYNIYLQFSIRTILHIISIVITVKIYLKFESSDITLCNENELHQTEKLFINDEKYSNAKFIRARMASLKDASEIIEILDLAEKNMTSEQYITLLKELLNNEKNASMFESVKTYIKEKLY
jgi:hypothetical protein